MKDMDLFTDSELNRKTSSRELEDLNVFNASPIKTPSVFEVDNKRDGSITCDRLRKKGDFQDFLHTDAGQDFLINQRYHNVLNYFFKYGMGYYYTLEQILKYNNIEPNNDFRNTSDIWNSIMDFEDFDYNSFIKFIRKCFTKCAKGDVNYYSDLYGKSFDSYLSACTDRVDIGNFLEKIVIFETERIVGGYVVHGEIPDFYKFVDLHSPYKLNNFVFMDPYYFDRVPGDLLYKHIRNVFSSRFIKTLKVYNNYTICKSKDLFKLDRQNEVKDLIKNTNLCSERLNGILLKFADCVLENGYLFEDFEHKCGYIENSILDVSNKSNNSYDL